MAGPCGSAKVGRVTVPETLPVRGSCPMEDTEVYPGSYSRVEVLKWGEALRTVEHRGGPPNPKGRGRGSPDGRKLDAPREPKIVGSNCSDGGKCRR